MKNFDKTPSFYNSKEVFDKYLNNTSYYKAIQKCLIKIVNFVNPKKVIELGSATGSSTFKVAEKFKNTKIIGYDFRANIVEEAKKLNKFDNVDFICKDMLDFAKEKTNADMIFLLYAFHHIIDPLQTKIDFLKNLHKNMKIGAYICILETFIPEDIGLNDKEKIVNFWQLRSQEGYASTFWNALKGRDVKVENLTRAKEIADFCKENEYEAGLLVAERKDEYLVHKSWIKNEAEKIGFKTILIQDINALGEGVILLQK